MIKYSLVKRKNPLKKDAPLKVHATAQANEVLSLDDIAQHIISHGSVYDKGLIKGVVETVAECVREQLLNGNQVVLGELGKFEIALDCEGADSYTEFGDKNIKDIHVRWKPSKSLKNLREEATFEEHLTRQVEKDELHNS